MKQVKIFNVPFIPVFVLGIAVVIILVVVILNVIFSFNDHLYIITITDKERITSQDSDKNVTSKYLIFGDDENGDSLVFENTDSLLRWKFNLSNIQSQLKEGETYIITVIGYRIPLSSSYENIIKVEKRGE